MDFAYTNITYPRRSSDFAFLRATQLDACEKLAMSDANGAKDINRLKFLTSQAERYIVHPLSAVTHRDTDT